MSLSQYKLIDAQANSESLELRMNRNHQPEFLKRYPCDIGEAIMVASDFHVFSVPKFGAKV